MSQAAALPGRQRCAGLRAVGGSVSQGALPWASPGRRRLSPTAHPGPCGWSGAERLSQTARRPGSWGAGRHGRGASGAEQPGDGGVTACPGPASGAPAALLSHGSPGSSVPASWRVGHLQRAHGCLSRQAWGTGTRSSSTTAVGGPGLPPSSQGGGGDVASCRDGCRARAGSLSLVSLFCPVGAQKQP